MKYDLLLTGGDVMDPSAGLRGVMDVGIAGGKIAAVAPSLPASDARRTISVKGRLVTPGLVVLGAVLFVEPFMKGLPEMATTVLFAAWSAATLLLLSSYAVSQLSPRAAGLGLGLQFTAATAGQMAGAAGAGAFSFDRRVFVLWAVALAAVALALWRARPRARVA